MMRRLLLPLSVLLLSGCGLTPVYQGGTGSASAQRLAGVSVAPIPGKAGWLVRNALNERIDAVRNGPPRYTLTVTLDDRIDGLGLQANDNITRERRTLRARFQLHDNSAPADAPPILDEAEQLDEGLDVASSEYATVAAEDSALERLADIMADHIVARVANSAREHAAPAPVQKDAPKAGS